MTDTSTQGKTVLFVCRHGAAKSVLAAADFRRLARERGLSIRADSAGVEPDDRMSPVVAEVLGAQEPGVHAHAPRQVTSADLAAAWQVITFDLDPDELPALPAHLERWDDLPAVSENLPAARDAIGRRLEGLIRRLAEPVAD
jgi:protein-tyrosine-phosphatase